jgi:hypothetical protein
LNRGLNFDGAMKMKNAVFASMLLLVACGSDDPDNVGACREFVEAVECGTSNVSAQYPCENFASTTCDIADYFDCLADKYVCVNGMYDSAKLAMVTECAPLASCR